VNTGIYLVKLALDRVKEFSKIDSLTMQKKSLLH